MNQFPDPKNVGEVFLMWFAEYQENVLKALAVNPDHGLSDEEAKERLERYGSNRIKEKPRKSLWALFFAQLKDMLIYILLGAALITIIIGEYVDSLIIFSVVIINAIIGMIQEYQAGNALEALQRMTTPKSLVKRAGEIREISSEQIVPGDIVLIEAGRYIPADLRLLESVNLQIEESALTGESVPVHKNAHDLYLDPHTPLGDISNMAYMSTLATYGRGTGVVVATAMETEVGKIAGVLEESEEEATPLQKRLYDLGRILGYLALGICALIFIIALLQRRDLLEMFLTALSLAVAAIPEGLPAIVVMVLALGITRMSQQNAIVKKLPAVETLGSVNIICSDKTGTLTQNKMTVVKFYTLDKLEEVPEHAPKQISQDIKELIRSLVLCSDATYEDNQGTGDPTEIALLILGERYNLSKKDLEQQYKRVAERPFDSERKMMSTLNEEGSVYRVYTKGAIDQILKISSHALADGKIIPLTEEIKARYLKVAEEMSDDALRVLGAAYKDTATVLSSAEMEKNLIVLGIVGMIDPPRLEVKDSIRVAKMAGITTIMITGDHKNTAVAIAKILGIADSLEQSITGTELDQLSDDELREKINIYRVFARVSPAHKVKIVKAYKAGNNIVSMTGDGVNDAPSLKIADVGVAMGITGTDVAKEASDIVLTDDNFSTIVQAIEEGRNIFNNIHKAVVFLLSCNLGEVITIFASILFFWPVPLLPTQILWINLITDSLPAIALGIDPGDRDVMKKRPRDPGESFFAQGAGVRAVVGGLLIGILSLAAFYLGLREFGYHLGSQDIPPKVLLHARTLSFVVLAGSQLFYSLTVRSSSKTIFQVGLFSNRYLIGAILIGMILQAGVTATSSTAAVFKVHNLSLGNWGLALAFSLTPLLVNEIIKVFRKVPENNSPLPR
jgi:Ca2+-transporting ATPase